jgi:N-acetylglucosamine kinase-like BadF-type ATPase
VGREVERRELAQALRGESVAERVVVVTDVQLAEAAAFGDGPGIVLSAGPAALPWGVMPRASHSARADTAGR